MPKTADFILDRLRQWGFTETMDIPVTVFCRCWGRSTEPTLTRS